MRLSAVLDKERIAEEMTVRGISVADVARKTGLSTATIYNALKGKPITRRSAHLMLKYILSRPDAPEVRRFMASTDEADDLAYIA